MQSPINVQRAPGLAEEGGKVSLSHMSSSGGAENRLFQYIQELSKITREKRYRRRLDNIGKRRGSWIWVSISNGAWIDQGRERTKLSLVQK